MPVAQNIKAILAALPLQTRLVAVSKFHPVQALQEAYQAGQRIFGESRVQELCEKQAQLPPDIKWHFIGHLQTNKVKFIAPFVSLVHGVDSDRLLQEIDRQAALCDRKIRCLLQVHIACEETKFGFLPEELTTYMGNEVWRNYPNIELCGLMGMASNTDDETQIRREFRSLKTLFDNLKRRYFSDNKHFCELSMGMSDDYRLAVEEGSTLVRIGSIIFGAREY